jgi:hypothetical protein
MGADTGVADTGAGVGDVARIAMWSGPRTVSTALMRAWENRPDTIVVDEPLYAFYLSVTGLDHPGRDEVIASQPADWRVVLRASCSARCARTRCRMVSRCTTRST